MKKSTYMDRAMRSSDPRFARVLGKLGYQRSDLTPVKPVDELADLRAEYQRVFDKKPFHGWDAEALRAKIAEQAGE